MNNTSYQKKTGILGGTFNPIHTGHLMLAQNALEYCGLDEVLMMPSGCSYFKDQSTVASAQDRINMTVLAIEGNDNLVISTIETERSGNSYTYETLDILCERDSSCRYHYIIGADTLFPWKHGRIPRIYLQNARLYVPKGTVIPTISLKFRRKDLRICTVRISS